MELVLKKTVQAKGQKRELRNRLMYLGIEYMMALYRKVKLFNICLGKIGKKIKN